MRSTSFKRKYMAMAAGVLLASSAPIALAAIQQHTFSISGDNGETGTGMFTWDDQVVADGQPLSQDTQGTGDLLSVSITISGGNVVGGSTTFSLADCGGAWLEFTPDFMSDINFWCNNGTNSLSGIVSYTNILNDTVDQGAGDQEPQIGDNSSTLTFAPVSTSQLIQDARPIPIMGLYGLLGMSGLLGLLGAWRLYGRKR